MHRKPENSRRSSQRRELGSSLDSYSSAPPRRLRGLTPKDPEPFKEKTPASAPIKIRLNIPDKEEDTSCSSVNSKGDKPSPQEFTTKRGRKTTRVTYNTYSEEEHELLDANISGKQVRLCSLIPSF